MRIISWNVNGIRAAIRKGLDEFVERLRPDILMLQEIRCLEEQLPENWSPPEGMQVIYHPAVRKGYSGVSTWSNCGIKELGRGMSSEDDEGRILITAHGDLKLINTYLPSGSSRDDRQLYKENWMEEFLEWLRPYALSNEPVIVAGDLNIAHTEDDIWNPVGYRRTSGFLPNEREWFGRLLESGWRDVCREQFGKKKGPYSWWSNRGRARLLDRGWRIDYFLANNAVAEMVTSADIHREGGLVVSDHAPVIIDLNTV